MQTRPTSGGSYLRDPATGALSRADDPALQTITAAPEIPAPAPETDPEPAETPKKKVR